MANEVVFPAGGTFNGPVYATRFYGSQESVGNAMVNTPATSADAIDADKLKHQHQHCRSLANHGATPAALRQVIAEARGAGTIVRFEAGLVQPLTVGSVTVDLYKNGSSVLTAPITLNTTGGTGGTAYDTVAGAFASTTVAQGDTFEFVVAISTPTGGGGLWCMLTTRENPS